MISSIATSLAILVAASASVSAAGVDCPNLASQHFTYSALPYQADTCAGSDRGPQSGYNICNSTTEGPTSLCQTLVVNSLADFCLWGPPTPNSMVADTEGQAVAWCTQPGHGSRIIPQGAITGAQWIQTSAYVEVTGFINQALIDMDPTDGGGEMDGHGADGRGNAIGGIVFSNAFPSTKGQYVQTPEWHNFMGSGVFCIKACDPSVANSAQYCDNIYDRIGCQYNVPAAYVDNVFESCAGELQDPPGTYTGADGVVTTYHQPAESLGEITTMPYTARIPASSACTPMSSAALYTAQPVATVAIATTSAAASTVTGTGSTTGTVVKVTSVAHTSVVSTASASGTANGASQGASLSSGLTMIVGVVGVMLGAVVAL